MLFNEVAHAFILVAFYHSRMDNVKARSQHINWTELNRLGKFDPVTLRSNWLRASASRLYFAWLSAAKLERLVLRISSQNMHFNAAVRTGVRELEFSSLESRSIIVSVNKP